MRSFVKLEAASLANKYQTASTNAAEQALEALVKILGVNKTSIESGYLGKSEKIAEMNDAIAEINTSVEQTPFAINCDPMVVGNNVPSLYAKLKDSAMDEQFIEKATETFNQWAKFTLQTKESFVFGKDFFTVPSAVDTFVVATAIHKIPVMVLETKVNTKGVETKYWSQNGEKLYIDCQGLTSSLYNSLLPVPANIPANRPFNMAVMSKFADIVKNEGDALKVELVRCYGTYNDQYKLTFVSERSNKDAVLLPDTFTIKKCELPEGYVMIIPVKRNLNFIDPSISSKFDALKEAVAKKTNGVVPATVVKGNFSIRGNKNDTGFVSHVAVDTVGKLFNR